jgi:hypothetical protein
VRTVHLLAATLGALAVLVFARPVPVLSAGLCLVAVLAIGELAVRAVVREPLTPAARLGLAATAGLVSLPLIALILHLLGVRIEGRWLAAGLAVLAGGLGGCARKQEAAGSPPHPVHWVGRAKRAGTTIFAGLSTIRPGRTSVAVAVPALLAILIGGTATVVYQRLPHPAEPGYTSLALAGWAAGIARPVAFPAAGLEVPLEVSSAGEPPAQLNLLVQVGGRPAGPGRPVTIAGGTQSVRVHVPSPPDGCLHAIRISLGPASTIFYGRGPGPARMPAAPMPPARLPIRTGWVAC